MTSVEEKSIPFGFTTHHTISYSIQLSQNNGSVKCELCKCNCNTDYQKSCLRLLTPDA